MDFTKIYCKSHPCELINNFCTHPNCLVGLCPTCVCQHTDMHMQKKVQPQYQNIRTTFTRVHQEIQGQIEVISQDKERLGRLLGSIRQKKINFKAIISKTREDCLQLVREHFQQLQKKWEQQILSYQKENSLHSAYRLDVISTMISKQVNELIDCSRKMNSIGFVEEVPRIEKDSLVESQLFHKRLCQQLEDNEKYTPIINYCTDKLNDVTLALKRLLTLEFVSPFKSKITQPNSPILVRSPSFTFRHESPKVQKNSSNISLIIKRPSVEKPFNQSSLYSVPMVLTTSHLNKSTAMQQSMTLQKSRTVRANFGEISKEGKLKHKKSGLTLANNYLQGESTTSQKENTKR